MSKASIVVAIFSASLLAKHVSCNFELPTEPHFLYKTCQLDFGNYSANSAYGTNLETVLSALQKQASLTPFYSTNAGKGPADTVYGQFNCRDDVSPKICGECVQAAANDALRNCSGVKAGIIWYDECTLRFRNESMFGVFDPNEYTGAYLYSRANVSSDPDTFITAFNDTMYTLIEKAAVNESSKFATAQVELSPIETLYNLVQCSPDLNQTQCEACLIGFTLEFIERPCCGKWRAAVYIMFENCQMMYSTLGPFYNIPNAPPPPPSPLTISPPPHLESPPSTVTTASPPPPNKNGGSRIIAIRDNLKLGIVSATVMLLFLVFNS